MAEEIFRIPKERMTKQEALRYVALYERMNEILYETLSKSGFPSTFMYDIYEKAQLEMDHRIAGCNVVSMTKKANSG